MDAPREKISMHELGHRPCSPTTSASTALSSRSDSSEDPSTEDGLKEKLSLALGQNEELRRLLSDAESRMSSLEQQLEKQQGDRVEELIAELSKKDLAFAKLQEEWLLAKEQLVADLSKRKEVQYELIRSQRKLCDLQEEIMQKEQKAAELDEAKCLSRRRSMAVFRMNSSPSRLNPSRLPCSVEVTGPFMTVQAGSFIGPCHPNKPGGSVTLPIGRA
mmetsp:Transcript_30173/g.54762  ORF Transcript_30173/g.54762 Transcript_30173/m.54762 type:complete len:218 (-) Transcript_30173:96-749(-)